MSREDLGAADAAFSDALKACLDQRTEHRDAIVEALIGLAARFIKMQITNRPEALYDYIDQQPPEDKSTLLESLAEIYREQGDLANSEQMYIQIFQLRAVSLGYSNEGTMAALQTAALLTQMQGKSPEDLYKQAYQGVSTAGSASSKIAVGAGKAEPAPAKAEPAPAAAEPTTAKPQTTAPNIRSTPTPAEPAAKEQSPAKQEVQTKPKSTATDTESDQATTLAFKIEDIPPPKPQKEDESKKATPPPKASKPVAGPGTFMSGAFSVDDLFAAVSKTPGSGSADQNITQEISTRSIPGREEAQKGEKEDTEEEKEWKPKVGRELSSDDKPSFAAVREAMQSGLPDVEDLLAVGKSNVEPEPSEPENIFGISSSALDNAFDDILGEPNPAPAAQINEDAEPENIFGISSSALDHAFDGILGEPNPAPAAQSKSDAEPEPVEADAEPESAEQQSILGISSPDPDNAVEHKVDELVEDEPSPAPAAQSEVDAEPEQAEPGHTTSGVTVSSLEGPAEPETTEQENAPRATADETDSSFESVLSVPALKVETPTEPESAPINNEQSGNGARRPERIGISAIARSTAVPIERVGPPVAAAKQLETETSNEAAPTVPAEVELLWKVMAHSFEERISALRKDFRDSADVIALDRISARPSLRSLIDRPNQPAERRRGQLSDSLDLSIATGLLPIYEEQSYRAYELTLMYGLLVRAELLHPLHPDIAQNVFRLGHLWLTDEYCENTFEMARAALVLSHELKETLYGQTDERSIYNGLCLARANALCTDANSAKLVFERAYDLALQERIYSRPQLLNILMEFAATCREAKLYELAAEAYEKIRSMHEEVSNNSPELFETLVFLVTAYNNAGDLEKAEEYHKKLITDLEWADDVNAMRDLCANRYEELEAYFHAEQLNKELLCNCVPTNALMGKAVQSLIRVYEKWGRHRDSERLRNPQKDPDKDRPAPHMVTDPNECIDCAQLALQANNPFEAGQYYATLLAQAQAGDEQTAEALHGLRDIAIGYWHESKLDSAAACYASACEQAERLYGIAHQETVVLLHESGLLAAQRKLESLPLFEKAYSGRSALLGAWHPETAESAFEIASRLDDVAHAQRKEKLLRSAIAARSYSAGLLEDRTQQYLAEYIHILRAAGFKNTRRLTGRYFDSIDEVIETDFSPGYVIAPRPSTLPLTAETLESLLADVDTLKRSCGLTDKVTLLALNKIADFYAVEPGGELWVDIPATTHLEAALVCEVYGITFMAQGDLKNAEPVLACALKIRENVMGNSHPDTALTLMHIGRLHAMKNQFEQSLGLYTQALEIAKGTLGAHIFTLCITHNTGWLFHTQERYEEAREIFQHVSESLRTIGVTGILARQTCKNNLVMLAMKTGGSV